MSAHRNTRTPHRSKTRRGGALLWSVVGLALATAMLPVYVSLCRSLSLAGARGAHRLRATQVGTGELERIQASRKAAERRFVIPDLPDGRGTVTVRPASQRRLRQVVVRVTWSEDGRPAHSEWTTLVPW